MNLATFVRIAIIFFFSAIVGIIDCRADMAGDLSRALDEWSRTKHVALASEVRSDLVAQATRAVKSVHESNPSISVVELERLIPSTVVTFLNETQTHQGARNLARMLEDAASKSVLSDTGAFGPFVEYPILKILITPAMPEDFVVAVDGESYVAGVTTIRVKAGNRAVVVTRTNKPKCEKTISVTATGPNQIECSM